jgi:hypothetical protein
VYRWCMVGRELKAYEGKSDDCFEAGHVDKEEKGRPEVIAGLKGERAGVVMRQVRASLGGDDASLTCQANQPLQSGELWTCRC